jgi:pimeloyl-ACP methyl ester carboxylesterase
VILVGHSLGAVLTSHIALHHPERIEKLILISSSYIPPPYFKIPGMFFLFNMLAAISLPPIRPGHSTYPPGKHHKDIEVFGLIRTILRNSLRSYILSSKEILKSDIGTSLHNIQVPTLIISGNKDTIFPTPISLHIRSEIKDSALKVIDGGNHVVILNNAEEVARDISGFLGGAASEAPLS